MIIIKRSTPTVSREITPHYDRKGKYSQKRTRENTILKSKVHLATSGSRVWPVTIFNAVFSNVRPDYMQAFRSLSILSLVVEHFLSSMRERYPMLYLLQYAQLLMPTIQETVKKLTNTLHLNFIYYTRKTAHYPDPAASVRYSNLTWPKKPPTVTLTAQDLPLLQEWQRQYCGSVRQRSVRDISKYDAGTLPSFASAEETNPAEVACNTMRFEGEQAEEENQPLVGVEVVAQRQSCSRRETVFSC